MIVENISKKNKNVNLVESQPVVFVWSILPSCSTTSCEWPILFSEWVNIMLSLGMTLSLHICKSVFALYSAERIMQESLNHNATTLLVTGWLMVVYISTALRYDFESLLKVVIGYYVKFQISSHEHRLLMQLYVVSYNKRFDPIGLFLCFASSRP